MIAWRVGSASALVLGAWLLGSQMGCSQSESGEEATGSAIVAVSQAPGDGSVSCIAVNALGSHAVTQSVDVSPFQSTVLQMNGLPVGTVRFTAEAYATPCSAVDPGTPITWVSDPVLTTIDTIQPASVSLSMHRNGKASIDVDFQDEPSCRAPGAPCFSGAECCSQACIAGTCQSGAPSCLPPFVLCGPSCADLSNDPSNCGSCGVHCPPGAACSFGACTAFPTCADGIQNGNETAVDCGGSCAPCPAGQGCASGNDCQSGLCINAVCAGCSMPSDCPGVDTECQTRFCAGGQCGIANAPAGIPAFTQTPGDCTTMVCDGNGSLVAVSDASDIPVDDGNQCTFETCTGGSPTLVIALPGTPCNQNGGTACDFSGHCN